MKKKYINTTKKKAEEMLLLLEQYYPDATCGLHFNSPIELVVALILAAQCTDERVNQIVPILFEKYPNVYALSEANVEDIARIVKPCGFYINKSLSIYTTANILVRDFDGTVPDTMEQLCKLRGIGRKSGNIILQECFHHTVGIAVDTHVTRIARKAGLSHSPTPEKIEQDLLKKFPKPYWSKINHIFVWHGRAICIARRPQCDSCPIQTLCPKND